jgi:hypothetical protein
MLDLASHSLTTFQAIADELTADADANAVPPILDAMATTPDAEAKYSVAANTAPDELAKFAAAATAEPTTCTSPRSATYTECTKPRKSRFGPLFQVWDEWSSCPTVPQQAVCSWNRRPVTTSRIAELYLRQGQPRDY